MLWRSLAISSGSLRQTTIESTRPLLSTTLSRPSIRSLATSASASSKAQQHYNKAFQSVNRAPSSSVPPLTSPYPTAAPHSPATGAASAAAATAVLPPSADEPFPVTANVGSAVSHARRLSPSTPSPFPVEEPPDPYGEPGTPLRAKWERFAYWYRTFLQGGLVLGYTLMATRIILMFYPDGTWITTPIDRPYATTSATNAVSSVTMAPATVESSGIQTPAQ